jgi:heat-inducible transcriptional repressor
MTPRQEQILAAIVESHAQSAEPVGSLALSQSINFSPATIRAEMAALEQAGLITHRHTSAGRVPTDQGYRHYVNSLSGREKDSRLNRAMEQRVKSAGQSERAVKMAAETLAEVTHNVGLATLPDRIYFTGLASLFGQPEFFAQASAALEAARLIDSLEEWLIEAAPKDPISVFIGHENPIGKASGLSLIIARYRSPYSDSSYIGVMGPTRQSYGQVVGLVDYARELLEEELT